MSRENVEVVRQVMEGVERRDDWEHLEVLAEDVVYRPIREITDAGEYRGRKQVRRYMEGFFTEVWDEISITNASYRDLDDKVIVRIEFVGRGRASAIETSGRTFSVFTVRDGQIVRWEDFTDRQEALDAAGLRE
jgi:ketosteroid isomerase-like protein